VVISILSAGGSKVFAPLCKSAGVHSPPQVPAKGEQGGGSDKVTVLNPRRLVGRVGRSSRGSS
jgi:hypothetical protein